MIGTAKLRRFANKSPELGKEIILVIDDNIYVGVYGRMWCHYVTTEISGYVKEITIDELEIAQWAYVSEFTEAG